MGQVISLEDYRQARAPRPADAARASVVDTVERLADAVTALETALGATEEYDDLEVRRELVAVSGAVGLGRYGFAAARTERLVQRLQAR